ncbi:MAG: hypothetical protein ACRDN8_09250, partial [Thermoleophilaceae bacterium]
PAPVVQAPPAPAPMTPVAPAPAPQTAAQAFGFEFSGLTDPLAQAAPVAPSPAPTPAPVVVQAPVDPLAGVPEACKAAIALVGGPETDAGKAILATLAPAPAAPAQPKRTRRSKAEMEAARAAEAAAAPKTAMFTPAGQGFVPPTPASVVPLSAIPAAVQGELMAPATAPAPIAVAPPGDDLLAGVDALLAGLDNMGFDD